MMTQKNELVYSLRFPKYKKGGYTVQPVKQRSTSGMEIQIKLVVLFIIILMTSVGADVVKTINNCCWEKLKIDVRGHPFKTSALWGRGSSHFGFFRTGGGGWPKMDVQLHLFF